MWDLVWSPCLLCDVQKIADGRLLRGFSLQGLFKDKLQWEGVTWAVLQIDLVQSRNRLV